jgi:PAS domain S-box-containing protein
MQFRRALSRAYDVLTTPKQRVGGFDWGITIALCFLGLLFTLSLPAAHESPIYAFLLAPVAISAWVGGWRLGVLAAVLTSLELKVWVYPSIGSFRFESTAHAIRYMSYLAQAGVAAFVFARLRGSEQRNRRLLAEACAARDRAELSASHLRQSEERLSLVLQSAQIGTWEWGIEEDDVICSPRCLAFFGLAPDTRMNYGRFLQAVHPDDRVRIGEAVRSALEQHRDYNIEMRALWPDGTVRWIFAIGRAHYEPGGKAVRMSGAVLDITDRKHTMEALVRSEKLASMGRMAATIAHEINNPVAAVMNSLYIARSSPGLPDQACRYLDIADEELKRVSHITRQSLGFYRESTAPSLVSVGEVFDSAVDLLKSRIKARHAYILKQYRSAPRVMVAAGELRQVACNLISNSLDAIAEHGTIALRVSSLCESDSRPQVRLTVADNGRGIDPAVRPQVFEPLFTTKESLGTGLGLWVSKQIIEKYGGFVRLRSSVDGARRGTTFSVILPAAESAERKAQAGGEAA